MSEQVPRVKVLRTVLVLECQSCRRQTESEAMEILCRSCGNPLQLRYSYQETVGDL